MPLQILVVDDEPQICSTVSGLLSDEGHHIATCNNGEDALNLIQQHPFDLIFLDLRLPGMDGLEVLRRMQENRVVVPTIMISAHADIELAVEATRLGAYNLLEKPLQAERVLLEARHLEQRLQLERERDALRQRVGQAGEIIGESPAMQELSSAIKKAAPSEARVLITGENGTGKELVAEAIHRHSQRRNGPFVQVNCAAIPRELIESELFGHERGSFTGATRRKIGLIEQANAGTLFLDEVGDMALETQAKLLRVLQQNELMRVGGTQTIRFDVRVIAATNKNLEAEIRAGHFREDLYFRLAVIPIEVPPLRSRREDIPLLADYFLQQVSRAYGRRPKTLLPQALKLLQHYHWPGNVRELRNSVERLVIMNEEENLASEHARQALPALAAAIPAGEDRLPASPQTAAAVMNPVAIPFDENVSFRENLENYEYRLLQHYFDLCQRNVSEMARRLRTDRANLHRKLQRYQIK
jgi:two-component system nitrogen regulation response regulator NtrX